MSSNERETGGREFESLRSDHKIQSLTIVRHNLEGEGSDRGGRRRHPASMVLENVFEVSPTSTDTAKYLLLSEVGRQDGHGFVVAFIVLIELANNAIRTLMR